MENCSSSYAEQQDSSACSCTASANLALMRKELERYKAMYERERDQFEEFQNYSKELEAEMELELQQRDKKLKDMETNRRRFSQEAEQLKSRVEQQRRDQIQAEEQLKKRLTTAEQEALELRQKLRAVEQANDDMERRERIHAQQLHDLAEHYDKCLERCALLEAGMFVPNSPALNGSAGILNGLDCSSENNGDGTPMETSIGQLSTTPQTIRETAQQLAAARDSNILIEKMLDRIDSIRSRYSRQNGGSSGSPMTISSATGSSLNGQPTNAISIATTSNGHHQ